MDPITTTAPPTTTPATTHTPAAAPSVPTAPAADEGRRAISADFNTFLKMLTVQMQNQDPLDPIDSADYAVQLATFSGVEQQVKTNDLLAALQGQLAMGGLAEVAGWVGREARAPVAASFDGAPVTVWPAPAAGADAAELVVRNAAGDEVSRHPIPVAGGPVEWAGVGAGGAPLPAGLYRFEVAGTAAGVPLAPVPAEVYARVAEVRLVDGAPVVVTTGGAAVEASKVTALRDAG